MSWHLSHQLTRVHQAVSITLLCSVGSAILLPVAQAATMGKTLITSSQHEPLAASISVSDINAAKFVADLASPAIYRQMGLTPTASMSMRFVATSATTGQILIYTSQPVSVPFADIVMAVNDNGKRIMIPKTLLMPMGSHTPIKPLNLVTTSLQYPNWPVVSEPIATTLSVRKGAPPPLFNMAHMSAPVQMQALVNTTRIATEDTLPFMTATAPLPLKIFSSADMPYMVANVAKNAEVDANTLVDNRTANLLDDKAWTQNNSVIANEALSTNASDKLLDILNIQVTRQIQFKSILRNTLNYQSAPLTNTAKNKLIDQNHAGIAAQNAAQLSTVQSSAIPSSIALDSTGSYKVQHDDSLWIISQRIAQQNNIDVQTVMTHIKAQNPRAFISQDADLLKADAQLNLPSYDILPSQQSLQTASPAQRQYYVQSDWFKPNKNNEKSALQYTNDTYTLATKRPSVASKPLAQAQFSVTAPGHNDDANSMQTTTVTATGNGLSIDILATLNSVQQRATEQTKRVTATSSTLSPYAKRLQLQNEKLTDLQARLKNYTINN